MVEVGKTIDGKKLLSNIGWKYHCHQNKKKIMTQEEREKRRQETLRKMRVYKLHVSEVDILEEAGEL